MAGRGKGVRISITGEFDPRAFNQAGRRLERLAKQALYNSQTMAGGFVRAGVKMQSVGRKMAAAGKTLTRRVTLPIVALGALSVKAFADFDDAMTKSLAIMGNLSKGMRDKLEKGARAVALTTKFSAKEAAESYFYLASAGLSAGQSLKALPVVAKFATAGNFDMALATDLLTDAQSALGLSVKNTTKNMRNMTRVGDVLVKANTLANATVEQFSESLTNKGAAALRLVNKPMEEGVALLAAWADQGVKGRIAGTYLSIMLRDLQTAALKNEDAWKKVGVSVFDSSGKMRNSADIIGELERATVGLSDKQKKQFFAELGFADKSFQVIATLLGKSDAIRKYEKALADAGGTTQRVASKNMKSAKEQLRLLKDTFVDIGISLGAALMPALLDLADKLAGVARWLDKLSPGWKKFILYTGLAAAALGPFLSVTGNLLVIGGKFSTMLGVLISRMTGVAAASAGANGAVAGAGAASATAAGKVGIMAGAMRALPWVALVAGATAAGVAVAAFYDSWAQKKKQANLGLSDAEFTRWQENTKMRGGRAQGPGFDKYTVDAAKAQLRTEGVARAIEKLQAAAAKADPGKPFKAILKEVNALRALEADPVLLKDIVRGAPLDTKDVGKLRSVRDRMMKELKLTRKQADAIMAQMFKNWKPQKEAVPKINKAAAQVERRVRRMAAKVRGTKINFSDPNTRNVLNGLDQIIQKLGATSGAARQTAQILGNLSTPRTGGGGGRYVVKPQKGGTFTGSATGYPALMHGTETVVSHRYPERGLRDLTKYGITGGGQNITIAPQITVSGSVYASDLMQMVRAEIDGALVETTAYSRRTARGKAH